MECLSKAAVHVDDVIAMGPVGEGRQWHLVVRHQHVRDRLLTFDHMPLNSGQVRFRSFSPTIAKVRVHWIPLYVPGKLIGDMLAAYGDIKQYQCEKSIQQGMENVLTMVRAFVVQLKPGITKDDLPFKADIVCENEAYPCLITVEGRSPRCIKCDEIGHLKAACKKKWCGKCRSYTDHLTANCRVEATFARVTTGSSRDPPQPEPEHLDHGSDEDMDLSGQNRQAQRNQQNSHSERPNGQSPVQPNGQTEGSRAENSGHNEEIPQRDQSKDQHTGQLKSKSDERPKDNVAGEGTSGGFVPEGSKDGNGGFSQPPQDSQGSVIFESTQRSESEAASKAVDHTGDSQKTIDPQG